MMPRTAIAEIAKMIGREPDEAGRAVVHRVITEEICGGVVRPQSKADCLSIAEESHRQGANGIILGCTEICMLIGPDDSDLPVFDTTVIHVDAALDFDMRGERGTQ